MATDSVFLRLVGGNVANPTLVDPAISAHDFAAAIELWVLSGEITKAAIISAYDLTATNDSTDLDAFDTWLQAANNKEGFLQVMENRLILGRDKANGLDGQFGFGVKSTFINGGDGDHSLENTGPAAAQFNAWYTF